MTRASQATGVKTSRLSAALPSPSRATPARSARPALTASSPEAVLNDCTSRWPWPLFSQAAATSVTTLRALVTSPRQTRVGPFGATVFLCEVLP